MAESAVVAAANDTESGRGEYTKDGSVDLKGNPVLRSKRGGWTACSFVVEDFTRTVIRFRSIQMPEAIRLRRSSIALLERLRRSSIAILERLRRSSIALLESGFTDSNYIQLTELYSKYKNKGFLKDLRFNQNQAAPCGVASYGFQQHEGWNDHLPCVDLR